MLNPIIDYLVLVAKGKRYEKYERPKFVGLFEDDPDLAARCKELVRGLDKQDPV